MSTIVIGDVHGCLEELDELIALVDPHRRHRLVFLGDLVDRGPDSAGVVRRVQELRAECVQGNHDEKHVRWAKHEAKRLSDPAYQNPMRPLSQERLAEHARIGSDGIAFLAALPVQIDLGDGWWAVHAGAAPKRGLAAQKKAILLRCRWVDEQGSMVGTIERMEGTVHWATAWRGPENIAYGHHVHDLVHPRWDRYGNVTCVGIDTGCCFGGKLTAYIRETDEVVQVSARAEYAKLHDSADDDA